MTAFAFEASEFVSVEDGVLTFWTVDGTAITPETFTSRGVAEACELALSSWCAPVPTGSWDEAPSLGGNRPAGEWGGSR